MNAIIWPHFVLYKYHATCLDESAPFVLLRAEFRSKNSLVYSCAGVQTQGREMDLEAPAESQSTIGSSLVN